MPRRQHGFIWKLLHPVQAAIDALTPEPEPEPEPEPREPRRERPSAPPPPRQRPSRPPGRDDDEERAAPDLPDVPRSGSIRALVQGYGPVDVRVTGSRDNKRDIFAHYQSAVRMVQGGHGAYTDSKGHQIPARDYNYFRSRVRSFRGTRVSGTITSGPGTGTTLRNAVVEIDPDEIEFWANIHDFASDANIRGS